VLVSDIIFEEDIESHLAKRYLMFPIFRPSGNFCLLTSRPFVDKKLTEEWIEQNFINKPCELFHSNSIEGDPAKYKIKVLNSNPDITALIESNKEQADTIRRNVKIPVILFSEFLEGVINESKFSV